MVRRFTIKTPPVDSTKSRRRKLCLLYVLSSLAVGSYLANLYLAEGFIFRGESFWPLEKIELKNKIFSLNRSRALLLQYLQADQLPTAAVEICPRLLGLDLRPPRHHPPGAGGERGRGGGLQEQAGGQRDGREQHLLKKIFSK